MIRWLLMITVVSICKPLPRYPCYEVSVVYCVPAINDETVSGDQV